MAGTSNLASWVRTHTASRGPSAAPTWLEEAVGPVDDDLVGQREAGLGGEHLPGVAHGDVVAEHLGDPDQRGGEVDRAEDEHPRRRGERLDEDRHRVLVGLAAGAVVAHRRGAGGQRAHGVAGDDPVEVGVAERARRRLALDERAAWRRCPGRRRRWPSDRRPVRRGRPPGSVVHPVERLDEEVDRAAAGEADGERLVVAVAEGDQAAARRWPARRAPR